MPICHFASVCLSVVVLLSPAAAVAQSAEPAQSPKTPGTPRWTAEFYGGGMNESRASGGTPIAQFAPGETFLTTAGTPSRAHASWRFGDGAVLFNEVAARFRQITGRPFTTITPIDSVLRTSASKDGIRPAFGVRVGREISPGLSVEIMVERSDGGLAPSDEMTATITAANESFKAAFLDLIGTAPVTGLDVTSDVTMPSGAHSQMRIMAAVSKVLVRGARWSATGTVGGGMQLRGGTAAEVTMNGRYDFSLFGLSNFFERDEIVIRFEEPPSAALGLLGLSATYDITPSTGLRLGVRAQVVANKATTTVQAKPFISTTTTPGVLPTVTTPALQFSNQTTPQSSLRPSLASTLTTFTGSGMNRQVVFTLGLVRRF